MLRFTKMEGLGNDYIYMDGISQDVPTNKEFIQKERKGRDYII